jgi:hypothetical protein
MGGGGLINGRGRGTNEVLTQSKGGKKFLNLNTMSTKHHILISIITKSKKEDSKNAISNDLETQNFQNFPARRQPW